MNFLTQLWSVIARSVVSWLAKVDNLVLSKISNLLTILILLIGLMDWLTRKVRQKLSNKKSRGALEIIEHTQRSLKAVDILNDPMREGEKIGTILENMSKLIGVRKMKKFFKWVWYNKEQLLSILYSVVLMVLSQMAIWTEAVNALLPEASETTILATQVAICVASVASTALTVRNVCVKYGLSSLTTIDAVLTEKAEAKVNELSPEQKKVYKEYIATLNGTLSEVRKSLETLESQYTRLTVLYNADNSLVADFESKTLTYQKKIAADKETIASLEAKVAHFRALLSGKVSNE